MKKILAVIAVLVVGSATALVLVDAVGKEKAEESLSFCGTVTRSLGKTDGARYEVELDTIYSIFVPRREAYDRLKEGKRFTFVFRHGVLVAIADGCKL